MKHLVNFFCKKGTVTTIKGKYLNNKNSYIIKSKDQNIKPSKHGFFISTDNSHIYPYLQFEDLINLVKVELNHIYDLLPLSIHEIEHSLTPLIKTAALMCSTLPASSGCHDLYPGGLFYHSIKVTLLALEQYLSDNCNATIKNKQHHCIAIFIASLVHDLGKVFTDYEITVNDKIFNPFLGTLDEFLKAQNTYEFKIKFIEDKHLNHNDLIAMVLGILLARNNSFYLLEHVTAICNLSDFYFKNGHIWEIVKRSDGLCVGLQNSLGKNHIDTPQFLIASLINQIEQGSFAINSIKSGVFYIDNALLIAYDSMVLNFLSKTYGALQIGADVKDNEQPYESAILYLRQKGAIAFIGLNRIYNWYRLTIDNDLLFVRAFILKTNTLSYESVNYMPLGNKPNEIKELEPLFVKNATTCLPGIIYIPDGANLYERLTCQQISKNNLIFGSGRDVLQENLEKRAKIRQKNKRQEMSQLKQQIKADKQECKDKERIATQLQKIYEQGLSVQERLEQNYNPAKLDSTNIIINDNGQIKTLEDELLEEIDCHA